MTNNKQQTPDKNYWLITINSWGTHLLYGTEEEAEDFRKHKCRWEQSIGIKRIANNEEILTYGAKTMINNKQTEIDVAELAMKLYPFSNSERNAFITGYNQAKEMEKERMIQFAKQCLDKALDLDVRTTYSQVEQYYEQTYGGGEQ